MNLEKSTGLALSSSGGFEKTIAKGNRRLDIQGLRALAVIAVVLYHSGVPVNGGFVGVDIFFVISGFVITLMLMRELRFSGRVDFGKFFRRRFMRLTPALALVLIVTIVLSFLLQSPLGDQKVTAATAAGSLLLAANAVIFRTTGGYFEPAAENNPLLHTWSLAVEEQFYVIFPFLLVGFWWIARRSRMARSAPIIGLVLITAFSLALTVLVASGGNLNIHPFLVSFYSPLLRVWEFGAGALLAFMPASFSTNRRWVSRFTSWTGLALIGVSLVFISAEHPFPGPLTLLPVIGTALVIHGGSLRENSLSMLLSTKPFQFVGDISYSWYLWHWPFIVFALVVFPEVGWVAFAAGALSIVPAVLSYRFVERPARNLSTITGRKFLRLTAGIVVPVFVFSGVLLLGSQWGWGVERVRTIQATHPGWDNCMSFATMANGPETNPTYANCTWTSSSTGKPVYLVGDSNASQYSGALIDATGQAGGSLTMRTAGGCPFVDIYRQVGSEYDGPDELCRSYYESTLSWLKDQPQGLVVMSSTEGYWIEQNMQIGASPASTTADIKSRTEVLTVGLTSTVSMLREAGHDVLIVDPLPHPAFAGYRDVPGKCSTLTLLFEKCELSVPLSEIERVQKHALKSIRVAVDEGGALRMNLNDRFCDDTLCSMNKNGKLLYQDSFHITVEASEELAEEFQVYL